MTIQQKTEIAQRACDIIFANEGSYTSINKNDNGAISIGKVQWHGNRALSLLQQIIAQSPADAQTYITTALYNEIKTSKSWATRVFSQTEADQVKGLLGTSYSHEVQDRVALSDVLVYIEKGIKYGLTDAEALIYFADGVNQYGTSSSLWQRIAQEALKKGGTLDAMYAATQQLTSNYMSRRTNVYNTLKKQTGSPLDSSVLRIKTDKTVIKVIQQWCNLYLNDDLNPKLVIDGIVGSKTKKALIMCLQKWTNTTMAVGATPLILDGSFGPKSKAACPIVSLKRNNHTDGVYIFEALLYINGYNPNGIDTEFDEDTDAALRLFQKEHNLTVDGEAGKNTFTKLVA